MSSSLRTFPLSGTSQKEQKLSWTKSNSSTKRKQMTLSVGVKKPNSWITSSFGGLNEDVTRQDKPKKSKQVNSSSSLNKGACSSQNKKTTERDDELWLEKYKPMSETELAVHKKKVAEVRSWLFDHLSCKKGSNGILLLTGSAGAGKTATVQVLANELGLELQEWINPVSEIAEGELNEYSHWRNTTQSQMKKFEDFILRANKYPSLSIFLEKSNQTTDKKMLLIEDLPNIFFREATKLHEVLSTYKRTGRSPVVFIVSDSHHGDSNVHKLFPKDIQCKLGIHNISFNPVAHTSLLKAMNRIISLRSQQDKSCFNPPKKETVDLLAQNSGGDIRTAINGLQFSCMQGKPASSSSMIDLERKENNKQERKKCQSRPSKYEKPSNRSSGDNSKSRGTAQCLLYGQTDSQLQPDSVTSIGGRDLALFLFRALGKILYCKRDPTSSDANLLPSHLSHFARNHLTFSPEEERSIESAFTQVSIQMLKHEEFSEYITHEKRQWDKLSNTKPASGMRLIQCKIHKIALQRNEDRRAQYWCDISLFSPEMLVFLDESGFDKRICREYGYSFIGTRAQVVRPHQNWGPRISAIPVISSNGLLDVGLYRGHVNEATFLDFDRDVLAPTLLPFNGVNPRSVVIMDNAAVHHTRPVLTAINATGALVVFLPPYSPDFNPCENIFSMTKSWIASNDVIWHLCDEPERMVQQAFLNVTVQDVINCMEHTGSQTNISRYSVVCLFQFAMVSKLKSY